MAEYARLSFTHIEPAHRGIKKNRSSQGGLLMYNENMESEPFPETIRPIVKSAEQIALEGLVDRLFERTDALIFEKFNLMVEEVRKNGTA